MKPKPRPQAPQRLQRIILWTALVLAWAGEVVAGAMRRFRAGRALEAHIARLMPRLTKMVEFILLLEALVAHGANFRTRNGLHSLQQITRALIGSEIRRMMRGRTLGEWIAKLAYVLRNRAAIVARMVRRLAHGLLREQTPQPREPRALALPLGALIIARADTS